MNIFSVSPSRLCWGLGLGSGIPQNSDAKRMTLTHKKLACQGAPAKARQAAAARTLAEATQQILADDPAGVAALLGCDELKGLRVVTILTGGNTDLPQL